MKKCLVIGGGFAGLSAAAFLSSAGFIVEVIEASPKSGGRAYSFKDEETSDIIDNGQHIMMGCYNETISFLNLIGAGQHFSIQENLKINFLKNDFNIVSLDAEKLFYPFNLAAALLNYKALTLSERLNLLRLFLKIPFISEKDLGRLTVTDWLTLENQDHNIRKAFWDILAIGALNTSADKASASIFFRILKEIFFRGNKAAVIILPAKGLTEAYCNNAVLYIQEHKGNIVNGETVTGSGYNDARITEIITPSRRIRDFDYIISAVPDYSFRKIFPQINIPGEYEYSSILSFHIWLKENPFKEDFYGLIDSPVHWIFNHHSYITIVISNANDLMGESKEALFEMVFCELTKFTGIKDEDIIRYRMIKEKRATFIPSPGILDKRPHTGTAYSNLFIAGDWAATGLPSTIESAVKSGRMAADAVINKN